MLPSGAQHVLSDGRQEAVICEVGATLRRYDVLGRPVCWGFGEHELSTGGRGQVLAPWPNRLEDGRYVFEGVEGHAPLDEPGRGNAIHGLVRWISWSLQQPAADRVHATCVINAQPAYPFSVGLSVDFRLERSGLSMHVRAENLGETLAPFGIGFHSYLHAGGGRIDDSRLRLPARRHVVLDERMLPRGEEPVAGGPLEALCGDTPAPIGARVLDDCFTGLDVDGDGRWRARLVPGAGEEDAVTLWADGRFGWAMVYTGDSLAPDDQRRAVAVEPMTCPPNALRTGEGLASLAPGEHLELAWGLSPDRLV